MRFSIRSGKGLGDSLYLQSVVRHLVGGGAQPEVCSNFPDVFRPLAGRIDISPFRRDRVDRVAHYISRKAVAGTDQFIDCGINAGIRESVALCLDWQPLNLDLVKRVTASGKPAIAVQLPRTPMGRIDGYGVDLLPDCRTLQRAIDQIGSRAFIVQIGAGEPLYRFAGIDLDLANRTSIADLLDVAWACSGALGYCSFIVPLAESLMKPALLVWSRRGLRSRTEFIRAVTPAKILHRPTTSRVVMDDCSDAELGEAVDAFCEQVASPALV